ncbi:hypothetical protein IQ276_032465 [Desmonostoc muscorum LEGE 12446]|uniref:Uncharacterized protein n=1 Tax=Desmonostoc muscorum LEGE 12446 TaxID=1828758 RepID=A0A8J6ZLG5_DESMC|nr:hypothetical protein [Desmonostoc muscorum]MCF2151057.1 hypothetical protein [Desmonostoc muscorum LEGE 12446]
MLGEIYLLLLVPLIPQTPRKVSGLTQLARQLRKSCSGSIDETWRLWNLQGQPLTPPFIGHDSEVNSIAFSPDSQMIVTGSGSFSDNDNTVRLKAACETCQKHIWSKADSSF